MKIEIKCRFSGSVLFSHEAEDNSMTLALEAAVSAGAYLDGAYLAGANLAGANLARAYLDGAYLDGAYLARAKIKDDCTLVGQRPIFQIGPIGSRCAYFAAYITDKGLRFDAGCQRQITREVFEERLQDSHGDNLHAKEYKAALALIDIHAELWSADNKDE